MERAKRKNPSQVRRDRLRQAAFLERRHQGNAATFVTPTSCMETFIARTVKEEREAENITIESGAGETSSSKVETCEASEEDNNNDTITDEKRLTPENIEELRRLIKEDMKKINGLYKDDLENWKSDKHENSMDQREKIDEEANENDDNMEDAKIWALKQKQSVKAADFSS